MTKRRWVGIFGAKNLAKVPALDFLEQKIGANVVGLDLGERKKLSNVVRLDSWEQKNSPSIVGVIFRKEKFGLGNAWRIFCVSAGGQTTQWQFRLLRGCAVARLRGCAVARLRGCGHYTECREFKHKP